MVTFSYPYATPTDTLILRDPERDSTEQLKLEVVIHPLMNGQVFISNKTSQTFKALTLTFESIDQADLEEIDRFFKTHRGHYMKFVDSDAREVGCKLGTDDIQYDEHVTQRLRKSFAVDDKINSDNFITWETTELVYTFSLSLETFEMNQSDSPLLPGWLL